ncbi:hypothetical protein RFI_09766 [Reticulomyxa filosa]|uniref:FAD/NAD(P)-binding domain-containing protein n=1 Tax=Reticulomyxa filosa TaxID=46433 RepID=X6NM96_RETFI|nr:hypothetical protein RFI_09766 [Reticulomyxa filosa]|eukprot:ETO27365.1 hypothetical protein RFI_09766 [Reticulomyxa filosa]
MSQKVSVKKYTYCIIGGGIAGVTCCEELIRLLTEERQKENESIVLLSASSILKGVDKLVKLSQNLLDVSVKEYSAEDFEKKVLPKETNEKQQNEAHKPKLTVIQGVVQNVDPKKNELIGVSAKKKKKDRGKKKLPPKKKKDSFYLNICICICIRTCIDTFCLKK